MVLERGALQRLAKLVPVRGAALGRSEDSHLAVAVIEVQRISDKVPAIEQTYSAGAVCLALLNAALAAGWGANWLSGWTVHDRDFVESGLGLKPHERVAGLIHLGTERSAPPERPRPDLAEITTWVSE